jgi:hypothetical protein
VSSRLAYVLGAIRHRVRRVFARRGLEPDVAEPGLADGLAEVSPILARIASVSVQGRVALGQHAGTPVGRLGGDGDGQRNGPRIRSERGRRWRTCYRPATTPRRTRTNQDDQRPIGSSIQQRVRFAGVVWVTLRIDEALRRLTAEHQAGRSIPPGSIQRDRHAPVGPEVQTVLRERGAQQVPAEMLQPSPIIGGRRSAWQ